ncbi:MAG: IS3 family transposase [Gemmatimonadaceae bacterium]
MSRSSGGRRPRRQFSDEFKEGAVRLVLDEGKTVGAVARELDLTPSALGGWVRQARAERTKGKSGLMKEEREELTRLRKENRELRLERDLLKKVFGPLRQRSAVAFTAIAAERAHVPVRMLCRWFGVSPSGFYASQTRPESRRAQEDRRLKVLLHASFTGGRGYYGSPRIHDDFIEWGEHVSRKRIIRLKQEEGLQARVRKRYRVTTDSDHDQPIADNLLRQDFTAERPNQRWVGDTSELRIGEQGKAYLAVILDLYSRFVVGWAISAVNDRHLTIKALEMALKRRCPGLGLLHHSDQGSTYASEDYQDVLAASGITCSMSRRGNCYDNAVMEAFFSTVKSEIGERFASHADAKAELFDYLEVFYNQRRRHSSAGRMSPAAYERKHAHAA